MVVVGGGRLSVVVSCGASNAVSNRDFSCSRSSGVVLAGLIMNTSRREVEEGVVVVVLLLPSAGGGGGLNAPGISCLQKP